MVPTRRSTRGAALLLVACALGAGAAPAAAQEAGAATTEDVLVALRDVGLPLEGIRVRSSVAVDAGGSALLQLPDGTLVDAQIVPTAGAWTVRDFHLVAGDADAFRAWTEPWRRRVEAASNFLAAAESPEDELLRRRRPEELAPLIWFEDPDESSRLWGLNPVTYRMMQALQVVPLGPMGEGSLTNPMPRRDQ